MASPQPPHVTAFALHDYAPKIVPAQAGRDWMDAFPAGQAYRCRPMLLANALGWNVLAPVPLDISWNGGAARDDLQITSPLPLPGGGPISYLCESHFSAGIFTLHVDHIFRTHPPGWNLLVTAPFNTSRENAVGPGGHHRQRGAGISIHHELADAAARHHAVRAGRTVLHGGAGAGRGDRRGATCRCGPWPKIRSCRRNTRRCGPSGNGTADQPSPGAGRMENISTVALPEVIRSRAHS